MPRILLHGALALCVLILGADAPARAQVDAGEVERLAKFKAVFIYNFIEYVRWPQAKGEGALVVGVLGESEVTTYLQRIVAKRKAGKRPINVATWRTGDAVADTCHVLYASPDFAGEIATLEQKLAGRNVLLIGDAEGATERGASINFALVEGRLKFEISLKALERAGLSMSSELLKLGLLVQ